MEIYADLHTHSTASDGQYSPGEIAEKGADLGLAALALTDHDTLDGLDEAVGAGARLGLTVLRGVELGAREHRALHILGYAFRPGDPGLEALCAGMRQGREERKHRILDFLREKGVDLCLEEVEALAGGGVIARPHFARAMVLRGYVATPREAFDRYLDTDEYQRIERVKPAAETCIRTIREAGGAACLAHPYQLGLEDGALDKLVGRLRDAGLEGLECHYPRHTPRQQALYLSLARKYGLRVTGGSDFHGERVKPDIALGRVALDVDWLLERAAAT